MDISLGKKRKGKAKRGEKRGGEEEETTGLRGKGS